MIFPSKLINFNESTLFKSSKILKVLEIKSLSVLKLYEKTKKNFSDLDEFIVALDLLYVLGKIELDEEWGVLNYVKND